MSELISLATVASLMREAEEMEAFAEYVVDRLWLAECVAETERYRASLASLYSGG